MHHGFLDANKEVAVKTVKTTIDSNTEGEISVNSGQHESMLAELKIFAEMIVHENVVQLLGVVTANAEEFWIVLEYCKHKGLDTFLTVRNALYIDEIVQHKDENGPTTYKVCVPNYSVCSFNSLINLHD